MHFGTIHTSNYGYTGIVTGDLCQGIRPMVTLKSDVKVEKATSDNDGSSPDKPWILGEVE